MKNKQSTEFVSTIHFQLGKKPLNSREKSKSTHGRAQGKTA